MKRFASILLLTFYLITTVGVNVSLHYCGGSLADISVSQTTMNAHCSCGSEMMEKDCCQTQYLHFELKDKDYKTTSFSFSNDLVPKVFMQPIAFIHVKSASTHENEVVNKHFPHLYNVPLRIKYQVFRV